MIYNGVLSIVGIDTCYVFIMGRWGNTECKLRVFFSYFCSTFIKELKTILMSFGIMS